MPEPALAAQITPMENVPWGAPLALYFTLIGLPSGLTLILWWRAARPATAAVPGASPGGGGGEGWRLDWRAHWTVLALLTAAGALLVTDLGRPERFFLMLTAFGNWDSPISLGAKLIAVKSALLALALYLLWDLLWARRRAAGPGGGPLPAARGPARAVDRALPWLLGAASAALAVYPAAVLARTWVSPLAATPGAALLYLLTALLMGGAAVQLLLLWPPGGAAAEDPARRRFTLGLLTVYAAALFFAGISVADGTPARESLDALLNGGWSALFYGGVLGAGLLLPLLTLGLAGRRRWAQPAAAVGVLAGACALRFLIFAA
ncbi:NrfD/PsrC family molybdoenzyme membrane anchor subunit [Streptomyces aidingensis]|uniref:Formate-dependent nitrite reductase, membrane component NrfD n=1 Tax=Streptomyces aidingensis TaxID=910347 RepID=A0A1I1NGP1_9ACTN|nr:NrfD/PsrC family molybdoenzyme membrane anchor subunit [Streptomyces aidingensis]SFC92900.1 Formate-dependent nitrite reductase, membrane component NrfD [Streptomyces aidingensis]